jgi:hypothetical protein
MRSRESKRREAAKLAAPPPTFDHSSGHADLTALVGDHLLGPEAAAATADWFPSRRGVSPSGPYSGPLRRKDDPPTEAAEPGAEAPELAPEAEPVSD